MTKLLRLTFVVFAVIMLATVIVSIPLPVNESNLNKRLAATDGPDRDVEHCSKRKRCPPPLFAPPQKGHTNNNGQTDAA
ncbi:6994_t:CDS:2 [Paraglomus occultum]|uniref:6994_t:CDS:1 n=1 Tax=Paraglomus occultum TaxID=144539 RepID=A0A9N9F7J8_9GLOM|nr:6994_t:CDS:2 [Paraglomus occultum]